MLSTNNEKRGYMPPKKENEGKLEYVYQNKWTAHTQGKNHMHRQL